MARRWAAAAIESWLWQPGVRDGHGRADRSAELP
jgi:hypothetical protein